MPSSRGTNGLLRRAARNLAAAASLLAAWVTVPSPVPAQELAPRGILAPGDAAVAGFSGVRAPVSIRKGEDPAERTFIDLDGPSLRVVDLSRMGGPPDARLVPAPKPVTVLASQIGQVFGVALDDATPPNIFVAASSAYGLPIVLPGSGDALRRIRKGQQGAGFMPGLWGGAHKDGGPGSIWRIDGVSGIVTLFANLGDGEDGNRGAALGGLAFDPDTGTLFGVDRESGIIHGLTRDGKSQLRYDHGVEGRKAAGLAPVPFDRDNRIDIESADFDTSRFETWGYAPPARRIFGLGVHDGRLYYAVADGLQIWSIDISRDSATRDPRFELQVPPAAAAVEISKILFDHAGRMILAERPQPTGAFDFHELALPNAGRVLRYALVASHPQAPRVWQPDPSSYAVGFPEELTNANGGAAIGFPYDAFGDRDRSTCVGFLWSTGEELRRSTNPDLDARLGLSGPLGVNGLQGNALALLRPRNEPPLTTYFIDYDDRVEDSPIAGHLGDVAIWRPCGPSIAGRWQMPWWGWTWWGEDGPRPPPPDFQCPADQKKPGFSCCSKGTAPDPKGVCVAWCPDGAMDLTSQQLCGLGFDNATHDPAAPSTLKCLGGDSPKPNQGLKGCIEHSPVFNPPVCPAGFAKKPIGGNVSVCAPTPAQQACAAGKQVSPIDGKCHALCQNGMAWPVKQCCAIGSAVTATGKCCPPGAKFDTATGQCQQQIVIPSCPPGTKPDAKAKGCVADGACPDGSQKNPDNGECLLVVVECLDGSKPDPASGKCPPTGSTPPGGAQPVCPPELVATGAGTACCPPAQAPGPNGQCTIASCPPPAKSIAGKCCTPADLAPGGACATSICGPSKVLIGSAGVCCSAAKVYKDASGANACCASGEVVDGKCKNPPGGGQMANPQCGTNDPNCCKAGYLPAADGMCCKAEQLTSGGQCCTASQSPSGANKESCGPPALADTPDTPPGSTGGPTGTQCCAKGFAPTALGSCCALTQLTATGTCCPQGQLPDPKAPGRCGKLQGTPGLVKQPPDEPQCAAGYRELPDGSCCKASFVSADGRRCQPPSGTETLTPVLPVPIPSPSYKKTRPSDDDDEELAPAPRKLDPADTRPPRGSTDVRREPADTDRRSTPRSTPPRDETKQEPPKREPPKLDEPKRVEPKREPPKREEQKKEPPKREPPKREEPKKEPPKREEPKRVEPKRDVPKKLVIPKTLKIVPSKKEPKKEDKKPASQSSQPNIR
ncbi:MAG: hypothetical protein JNM89_11005 [Hyphomicrobiaceae bacterium]|nr:hypothetical protein [Hyphomicrobiaceae bacterium]